MQYYLEQHEAISARTLARVSRLELSPTTIRNLMEDLSTEGLLTSAGVTRGRIPTQAGIRIYLRHLPRRVLHRAEELPQAGDVPPDFSLSEPMGSFTERLKVVSHQVAEESGYTALLELPAMATYPLGWIHIAPSPASKRRLLVTIHTLFEDLRSELIAVPRPFSRGRLEALNRYFGGRHRGRCLGDLRAAIFADLHHHADLGDDLDAGFLRSLVKVLEGGTPPRLLVREGKHLLQKPLFQDAARAEAMIEALADPSFLSRALQRAEPFEGGYVALGTQIEQPWVRASGVGGFCSRLGVRRGVLVWLSSGR